MLPVVASLKSVQTQMWFHTIGMVISSLLVNYSAHLPLWISIITVLLAYGFSHQLIRLNSSEKSAAKLFQWSITYLSAYSLLLVIGALL